MNTSAVPALHVEAVAAFQRQDWKKAYELSVKLLADSPRHSASCYIAGLAAGELHQWPQALAYLQQATRQDASSGEYAVQFAKSLSLANMPGDAVKAANRALGLSIRDAAMFDTLGIVYTRANVHERAAVAFRRAAMAAPDNAAFRYNFANSLMYAGDIDAAEEELEACIALKEDYWLAYIPLARMRRQTPERNHVDRLHALLKKYPDDATAALRLNMALAKEYEDLQNYPRAFSHLCEGKGAFRSTNADGRERRVFEAIMQIFPGPQDDFSGYPTEEPIFVIGMPRTGTTLVERIISSHPYVHSAGELHNFGVALKQAAGVATPSLLDEETISAARHVAWRRLGEHYLRSTRPMTAIKPHFVDKLPHHYLYLGFIAHALPNARIVCLRRNPLDTCLSIFRELFAHKSEFHGYTFDLLDIGRHYVLFDRLMRHWKQVLPGRILEVQYEALVDDQEQGSRAIVDHCGLPWNDACLHFEQNSALVTTPSAMQVRAPIYRSSVRRWEKYAGQVAPLREFLMSEGINCDS
jgi:tetratricopeptide (TPR) repeat protein